MRFRLPLLILLSLAAFGVWATQIANDGRGLFVRPADPPDYDALYAKLAQRISVAEQDTPLRDFLARLSVRHGVEIRIDEDALTDLGLTGSEPVSFTAADVSLRSAVRIALRLVHSKLTSAVQGERLMVTKSAWAQEHTEYYVGRIYPIAPLQMAPRAVTELDLAFFLNGIVLDAEQWWNVDTTHRVLRVLPGAVAVAHNMEAHQEIQQKLHHVAVLNEDRAPLEPLDLVPPDAPGNAEALAALDATTSLNFVDVPLGRVCAELSDQVGVPILLDEYGIDEELRTLVGMTPLGSDVLAQELLLHGVAKRKVTAIRAEIPLRHALSRLFRFRELELVPAVQDEVIWITPRARANTFVTTRLYPVHDLLMDESPVPNAFFSLITPVLSAHLIPLFVAPESWESESWSGGSATNIWEVAGVLVVDQRPEVHCEIEAFLAELRRLVHPAVPGLSTERSASRAEQVLAEKTSLQVHEIPILDVADHVRHRHGIAVLIDEIALERAGMDVETCVTGSAEDIPLGDALTRLLQPNRLTCVPRGDTLLITTLAKVEKAHTWRLYDVRHLVDDELGIVSESGLRDLPSPAIERQYPSSLPWYSLFGGVLALLQTPDGHDQVAGWLDALTRYQQHYEALAPITVLPATQDRERQLYAALAGEVSFDLPPMPLDQLADRLSQEFQLPIGLDERGIRDDDRAVRPNTPAIGKVQRVSLGEALRTLVEGDELAAVVRDGRIQVTTVDYAEDAIIIRIYPVRDLLHHPRTPAEFPSRAGSYGAVPAFMGRADYGCTGLDYDSLIELISTYIAPESWPSGSGPGCISVIEGALVIPQTWSVHREIERFLAQCRHGLWPEKHTETGLTRLEQVLAAPTTIQGNGKPLAEFLDEVAVQHGITVKLDALGDISLGKPRSFLERLAMHSPPIAQFLAGDNLLAAALLAEDPFTDLDGPPRSIGSDAVPGRGEDPAPAKAVAETDSDWQEFFEATAPFRHVERLVATGALWLLDRWRFELGASYRCVRGDCHDKSLGEALAKLLNPLGLGIHVDGEILRVGKYLPGHLPDSRTTRVYDVRNLLGARERLGVELDAGADSGSDLEDLFANDVSTGARPRVIQSVARTAWPVPDNPFITVVPADAGFLGVVTNHSDTPPWFMVDDWGNEGSLELYHGLLLARQTRPIHVKIQKLLEHLHAAARELPPLERLEAGPAADDVQALLQSLLTCRDPAVLSYLLYVCRQIELPVEQVVPPLLKRLREMDPNEEGYLHDCICRLLGHHALQAKEVVPVLAERLEQLEYEQRRIPVIEALGQFGDSAASVLVEYLERRVAEDSLGVRERYPLFGALTSCGPDAIGAAETLLRLAVDDDSDEEIVMQVIECVDPEGARCRVIVSQWKNAQDEELHQRGYRAEELLRKVFGDP